MGQKGKGDNVEFEERTKEVLTKVAELIRRQVVKYEWKSDEREALADVLDRVNNLRRS